MTALRHVRVMRRIRQLQSVPYPSHSAHRIPHSNKMKLTVAAKCSFEPLRDLEGVRHSAGFLASLGEHPDYVRNQALVSRIQKSEHMQHTRNCPHGVRSPTEAKAEALAG